MKTKQKLSDYTKKELIKLLDAASVGSEFNKKLRISEVTDFETFEELWSHVNRVNFKPIYCHGSVVDVLKVGKHWFTKDRFIDVDIPPPEFWPVFLTSYPPYTGKVRVTKENFETLPATLYYCKVVSVRLTEEKDE